MESSFHFSKKSHREDWFKILFKALWLLQEFLFQNEQATGTPGATVPTSLTFSIGKVNRLVSFLGPLERAFE